MTTKSKISIINKQNPTIKYEIWDSSKNKWRKVEEPNFVLNIGDELGIISKSVYVYRDGFFYTCINKNGVIFTLDSTEISDCDGFCNNDFWLVTKTPSWKFEDFIEQPTFQLFNLFD